MKRASLAAGIAALLLAASGPAIGGDLHRSDTCRPLARHLLREATPLGDGGHLGDALCYDFTRDGRRDVVLTGWAGSDSEARFWAAFRRDDDGFERVMFSGDCCRRTTDRGREVFVFHPHAGPPERSDFVVGKTVRRPSFENRDGQWRWLDGRLRLIRVYAVVPAL